MSTLLSELDRQIATLLDAKLVADEVMAALRERVVRSSPEAGAGNVPICIAMRKPPTAALMQRITARNAHGVVDMTPVAPEDFQPIEGITLPGDAYVLLDVDTGRARLNMSPQDSVAALLAEGRTPLTLEEGVMLAFLYPAILTDKRQYNCIQMPGSRRAGDQRVPSLWFSKGSPRLGWCWDRNVHTWLATASAACRLGTTDERGGGRSPAWDN
ncbi:MAG: hypothetical protein H0T89_27245 [Deltaproteobacteria bacterium]|nr:hypothetical protein [Deltaproteobacteria bacterium]MDQ3296442.1 DUF5701 family protein [Myxococcota bacterium]